MTQQTSTDDIRRAFERIEQDALQRDAAFERRALRNYLLHTLLTVAGRHDELFEYDTAVADPDYVFFDNGRRVQGRDAIARYHRDEGVLSVPIDQRVAMSHWGFAGEQTLEAWLPDGTLRRTRCAFVWRCDDRGRMTSLRFYPAARHESLGAAPRPAGGATLAKDLAPLVERVRKMQ